MKCQNKYIIEAHSVLQRFHPRVGLYEQVFLTVNVSSFTLHQNMYEYTVKKGQRHSRPQPGCHLPNSPWAVIIKLFPPREILVSDIPAGDGSVANLFLRCKYCNFVCQQFHPRIGVCGKVSNGDDLLVCLRTATSQQLSNRPQNLLQVKYTRKYLLVEHSLFDSLFNPCYTLYTDKKSHILYEEGLPNISGGRQSYKIINK